jgi:hypothetical protein
VEISGLTVINLLLRRIAMLRLAVIFLVVALIAAFLGFGGVAAFVVGRSQDSLRDLPHSRGADLRGTWVPWWEILGRLTGASATELE